MSIKTLSEKTLVPLGPAIMIVLAFIRVGVQIADFQSELRALRQDMARLWTREQMSTYSYQLKNLNMSLNIPDPNQIK